MKDHSWLLVLSWLIMSAMTFLVIPVERVAVVVVAIIALIGGVVIHRLVRT